MYCCPYIWIGRFTVNIWDHVCVLGVCEFQCSDLSEYYGIKTIYFIFRRVGISITYYGLQVNVKNLFGNQFLNFFLLSLMEIPSHIITWYFLERIGRRSCSVIAFSLCTISCLIPVIVPSGKVYFEIFVTLLLYYFSFVVNEICLYLLLTLRYHFIINIEFDVK